MQMIMFKMSDEYYLISAKSVEEIIDTVPITYVPLAPNWVKGLINLRGNVMTVIGLSELIGIPSPEKCMNILIMKNEENEEERKGLLIEEVSEVVDINEKTSSFRLRSRIRRLTSGSFRLKTRLPMSSTFQK